ncbi:MAG: PKD domain-containing protein [Bacteroidota bacterium]
MVNFYKLVYGHLIACFFLCLLMSLPGGKAYGQLSGSYTIDKNAAASSTNYTTFQSFFNALASSGVNGSVNVTVLNGPYTEQVVANTIPGASATNTITINGGGQVLEFNATASANRHTFRFNGADYVTINNLYIKALGTSFSWGVHFQNASYYNTLNGCTVEITNNTSTTAANNIGINMCNSTTSNTTLGDAAKYTFIKNCTIKGNGATRGPVVGIQVSAQSQNVDGFITLEKNIIQDFYQYGIYIYYNSKVDVLNNDISRPTRTNTTTTYGISMYYYCYRNNIIGNKIHNLFTSMTTATSTTYGIYCYYNYSGASNSVVASNAVYNIEHNGAVYFIYAYYPFGIQFAHNTVSSDLTTTNTSVLYGMYVYSGTTSMTGTSFVNNIISLTRPSGSRYAYYYYASIPLVNNNSYFVNGAGSSNFMATGLSIYNDFASWQSGTGNDANGSYTNPKFANVLTGDLTPTTVQLDGQGRTGTGILKDINGNNFSTTDPDQGAFVTDVNANVTRLALAGTSNCQMQTEQVKVWVKNASPYAQSGFNMSYRVNGGGEVVEPFTGTLNPGDSAQFTFAQKLTYTNAGAYTFESRIKGKPYVGPYVVNVNAAPLGAEWTKGAKFNGQFFSGNMSDPDIVANPDTVDFSLLAPTGYTNSNYGSAWTLSSVVAKTSGGFTIPASDYTITPANSSQNLRLRFKPSSAFTDSFAKFTIRVYSNTTMCFAPDIDRVIFVAPRPVAGSDVSDFCDGDAAVFASTSTISSGTMSYHWDFGDGTTSNYADNNKKYATYGTYNVKLTATSNYGYTSSITKTVNVYRKPTVNFTHSNVCLGSAVPFTDNSTVYNGTATYNWSFGDGSGTSTSATPNYAYANTGSYMATLRVTDSKGCMQELTKPVTTSAKPTADFSFPTLACSQKQVAFTNNSIPSGNTGYAWKFGNGNMAQEVSPVNNYATPGTYQVTLVALNEYGCADSVTKALTLLEAPAVNFTTNAACVGEPVNFTNTTTEPAGTTVTYGWDFGDGAISSAKNETHTFLGTDSYKVTLKAVATNGCENVKEQIMAMAERPIAAFSAPETSCVGQLVEFKNGSIANQSTLTYDWDLGNGTSTAKEPAATYTTPGTITVKLTVSTAQGCSETISKSITVANTPNSNFTFESAKTGDGTITFKPEAPNGSGEYLWIYGDGSTATNKGNHNYRFFATNGIFKITLKISENGCSSYTTKDFSLNTTGINDASAANIIIYPNPSAGNFVVDMGTETAQSVVVTNVAGQLVRQYNADAFASGKLAINLTDVAAGVYFVQVQNNGAVATQKITISR